MLLRTKLYIPARKSPNLVQRPRLIERINEGLQRGHKLTLISAPAGFGKTTLIADWGMGISEFGFRNSDLCWLSLDGRDNDPNRFLTYLIAALQTPALSRVEGLEPDIGERALGMLLSGQHAPAEMILTTLINEISAVPREFVLVLDDYHLIDTLEVDDILAYALDHLPPNMHLVIATREDLRLPLAGMRGRGQLTELRAADLRFTPAEAADFLNGAMGLDLSEEDVAALERRTEGWITGLQLAAISMQGSEDTAGFIHSFTGSHRFVLDYLVEEVLGQQSADVQSFLLQTAVLDRLTGPLCDAVRFSDTHDGQEILEMLERANMFIIPLDEERRWYRYHHLFADLLRRRLRQSDRANPLAEQIPVLHGRASVWYEENGMLTDAIRQALASGDFERVATLAELTWQDMDNSFQSATWLGWARALPDELVRARPVLCARYASALIDCGELEEVEQWLRDAERWLEIADGSASGMIVEDGASFQALPAAIALNRANHASWQGDRAGAIKYAELALELIPEEDLMQRAQAVAIAGLTYWGLGDLQAAKKALVEWMDNTRQMGIPLFAVASAFALADILVAEGRLQEAISAYDEALQLAQGVDRHLLPITAHHHLGLAMLYHEIGEEEKSTHHLQISSELGRKSTLIDWPYRRCLAHARLKESTGELDAALALLDEAKRVYIPNPVPDARPVEALKAAIYLKQGRLGLAQEWAQTWAHEQGLALDDDGAPAARLSYLREFEYLTLARVLTAGYSETGDERPLGQGRSLLDRLLKAAEEGKRRGSVIEILIVQALAHQAGGNINNALTSLQRAVSLAEPQGYVRIFVDEGPPMAELMSMASAQRTISDYANKLLSVFPAPESPEVAAAEPHSQFPIPKPVRSEAEASQLIEPLSPRELEVLQLIAEGLTNKQIADRLYLSPHTVKVHTRNIYGKLDAHHRAEAVARARELDILPSN